MIQIRPEVQNALLENRPIVLVESAFFAGKGEGNTFVNTTMLLNDTIREDGAVPAFLGILDGNLIVGMGQADIQRIADPKEVYTKGSSKMLLPYMQRNKLSGGANNALMLYAADKCGIPFAVTGGIGGVSRLNSFDISADLYELSRVPIMLFSAGPKSMLDLVSTKEVMETMGITSGGYKTRVMSSFFSSTSPVAVDWQADDTNELAEIYQSHVKAGFTSGISVSAPVPSTFSLSFDEIEQFLSRIMNDATADVTDGYLFQRLINEMNHIPGYDAQQAMISMFINNAHIAAKTAVSYADLISNK